MTNKDSGAIDHPDVVMMPPIIFLIALAGTIALEFLLPIDRLPPFAWSGWPIYLGGALGLAALGLASWAGWTMKEAKTNISPHQPTLNLTFAGPYRFTRNPIYIGFLLLLAGISLTFSLDWGIPMLFVLALTLHRGVILREEAYLENKFGEAYRAYKATTRRWL